ncbi:hypothetical protein Rhopal_002471-T1 [Rhodotorula paludigena]|uniref:MFS general substrate transporter n=1 Tax=Rhodotorula paludigena TaxID=86838 RepID=A0AAV5GI44_9BASI|nr:hypothetical protein Rhopal_002471-T1 [Rhodotorula paludigena]
MAGKARYAVLAAATLASRLDLNSTQINSIGACGNLGVYLSSPLIGRIVDRRGPKPTLVFAAAALCSGYLVVRAFYTTGDDHESGLFARFGVPGLILAELLTGIGSTAGLSSAGNSVAKSFNKRRAAALSVVLSAFGLSAFFYSSLSSLFLHPRADTDVTSSFLLLLALGSLLSMLVGLLFVRPIPRETRHPASDAREAEEAPVEAEATLPEAEEQAGGSGTERTPLLRSTSSKSIEERNIAGWALLRELDFYLIFLFNGLCAGVGLCYINNLGQVVRSLALAAPIDPSLPSSFAAPSPAAIALLQSRLVSLLSLFNFLGRLLSGFTSDYLLHHPSYRLPRVFFLPLTAALYLASQLVATRVTSTSALWAPTALTGLAHGCLFGISGIVGLERFGMRSFSQTNGVLALAPALFGQATNLIFGRIYDSRSHPVPSLVASSAPSLTCTLGRACYLPAFELTSAMSLCALGVGLWLAIGRGAMRVRAA